LNSESTPEVDGHICEVEQVLRERDNEIAYLRETLEQNEQVIFKVYEEKENAWKRELSRLRAQLEASQSAAQRALQRQQHQIAQQAQQLRVQQDQLSALQSRCQDTRRSESESAARLQTAQQKAAEQAKLIEMSAVRLQQAAERMELQSKEAQEARRLSEQLAVQLASAAEQRVRLCNRFAVEQQKWTNEKREVIAYHKQMQAAHVRTQQRNKQMEMELQARVCAQCLVSQDNGDKSRQMARPATPVNANKQLQVESTPSSDIRSALPVTCE
jgi:chromosome segregation ATPase